MKGFLGFYGSGIMWFVSHTLFQQLHGLVLFDVGPGEVGALGFILIDRSWVMEYVQEFILILC
jgi:hypothetical protein